MSCSQWSSALTCCLLASVPPCMLGGQSPGTGSSAPSSGSASPSSSTLITGNTSQDLPLFPATHCTCPQMMLWCGTRRERQHLPGRSQHPSLQPLVFPPPQLRVLGGMTASAQPTGHLMVGTSPPGCCVAARGTATVPRQGPLCWDAPAKPTPPGIIFLYFFKESKIFQLQRGDAV